LQGSQKVPQKSTSTTLPRSDLSDTLPLPPATALTLKSGAGFPTSPELSPADSEPLPEVASPPHASSGRGDRARARAHARRSERMRWVLMPEIRTMLCPFSLNGMLACSSRGDCSLCARLLAQGVRGASVLDVGGTRRGAATRRNARLPCRLRNRHRALHPS